MERRSPVDATADGLELTVDSSLSVLHEADNKSFTQEGNVGCQGSPSVAPVPYAGQFKVVPG